MSDILQLLRRQARWQKSRQALSWPEKIRIAERVRDSVAAFQSFRKTVGDRRCR